MDGRTKNESKMRFASEELMEFYTEFEEDLFFEDLRAHRQKINRRIILKL
jgi:hypothetical protein